MSSENLGEILEDIIYATDFFVYTYPFHREYQMIEYIATGILNFDWGTEKEFYLGEIVIQNVVKCFDESKEDACSLLSSSEKLKLFNLIVKSL